MDDILFSTKPVRTIQSELDYLRGEIAHYDDLIQRWGDFLTAHGLGEAYTAFCKDNPIPGDFAR